MYPLKSPNTKSLLNTRITTAEELEKVMWFNPERRTDFWREREAARIACLYPEWPPSNIFTRASGHLVTWLRALPDHYVVPGGRDHPKMLYHTASMTDGIRDIKTAVKTAKLIRQLRPETPQPIAAAFANELRTYFEPPKVLFATTPDEVEWVYRHGPRSCMSKTLRSYSSASHPTRLYGQPPLAIAYLLDKHRRNRVIARTVVNQDKGLYLDRIYGNSSALRTALNDLGYNTTHQSDLWDGVRLRSSPHHLNLNTVICPYFDHSPHIYLAPNHELVLSSEINAPPPPNTIRVSGMNTTGLITAAKDQVCQKCSAVNQHPRVTPWIQVTNNRHVVCPTCAPTLRHYPTSFEPDPEYSPSLERFTARAFGPNQTQFRVKQPVAPHKDWIYFRDEYYHRDLCEVPEADPCYLIPKRFLLRCPVSHRTFNSDVIPFTINIVEVLTQPTLWHHVWVRFRTQRHGTQFIITDVARYHPNIRRTHTWVPLIVQGFGQYRYLAQSTPHDSDRHLLTLSNYSRDKLLREFFIEHNLPIPDTGENHFELSHYLNTVPLSPLVLSLSHSHSGATTCHV